MNKFVLLASAAALAVTAGCANNPTVTPAFVADSISSIDSEVIAAVAQIPNLPPAVAPALADLKVAADDFSAADTAAAKQTVVKRVAADLEAVVNAIPVASLTPAQQNELLVAKVAIPVIFDAVGLVVDTTTATQAAQAKAALAH